MQNILDYLDWRGDISFATDGFNEVDNLIMSVLSYLEFEGIVSQGVGQDSTSLFEAARQYEQNMNKLPSTDHNQFLRNVPKLLFKAALTERYGNIQLSGYENQIDYEESKQFSAVVFSVDNDQHFIAFRGTDDTIIGWQEDFQMSFMDEVHAQKQAVIYINKICSNLSGKFYFGGHSKGGNLAVYAAIHADEKVRDRIIAVYNNDGPGFLPKTIQSEEYQGMLEKITTMIPKSSVVGMLLEHGEEYKVVNSNETGVMQHDAFSWEVKGTGFVYEKCLTKNSLIFNSTVRSWFGQLSVEERKSFVTALFDIIKGTRAKTIGELSKEKLFAADAMIKAYKNMDELTKSHLKKTIELFFAESQKTLKNSINDDIDMLRIRQKYIKHDLIKKVDLEKYKLKPVNKRPAELHKDETILDGNFSNNTN